MAATFRNLAVVIGINAYRAENGIKPLGTAVNDARAIAQLLKDEYKYSQIYELYDEQATYEGIKTLLNETLPKEVRKSDRLLFYFAGHGITRKGKDGSPAGYLIPQNAKVNLHNAENDQSENFLPMQELYDAFKTIDCHHLLVILDCCYAGMFRWTTRKLGVPYERIYREHYARFIENPAWQVIASAAYNQEALDLVTDQRGSIPGTNHSPFALALLQALGNTNEKLNADLTGDGVIITPELYLYVDKEVNRSTSERQTPGFWSLRDEYDRGEFIFTKPGFDPAKNLILAPKLNANNNPYRGLNSFEERHSRFFFGRTALVEELSDRLSKSGRSLTIVLGVSGSGKSSLVKAGLIPYLRNKQEKDPQAQKWYILDPMRPGESPFTALARIILLLEDVNLLSQLNQIKGIDEVFKPKTELKENSDRSQKVQQTQTNSEETDPAFTKLADSWNSSTPEAKLLLVLDYFKQLQKLCPSEELTNLKKTIKKKIAQLTDNLQKEPRYLSQVIENWNQSNPNSKLLLIIDQFEELITMAQEHQGKSDSDQKDWQQFLSILRIALASHRHRLHIVLTLRADFEPRFLNSALKAHWRKGRFPVRAMNSDELREAIEQPARKQALYFEPPDLVGRLIDEAGQMPGALPLLSFTLSELYIKLTKRWIDPNSSDRALRIEDYKELDGVAGALTRWATEEYDNLVRKFGEESGRAYQATMRRVMLRMVTIQGGGVARRQVPESELVYPDPEENKRVVQVIDRLVKARLLVKGQETGEPYVEPAHDFLVRGWGNLQKWIKEEQEDLALQQRLTPAANDWSTGKGGLWTREVERLARLEKVLESSDNNWLNQRETEFVTESKKQRLDELKEAERQRDEAIQGQIGALASLSQSQMLINNQLEALLAGVKAGVKLKGAPWLQDKLGSQVFEALQQAVYTIDERNRLEGNTDPIYNVSFSPDGKFIATANWDKTVKLWSTDGTLLRVFEGHTDEVNSVAFSRSQRMLASAGRDQTVRLWNIDDGTLAQTLRGHTDRVWSVSFGLSDETLTSASEDGTIKLWSINDGKLIKNIQSHSGAVLSVSFSPDGKLIASGGWDQPPWQGTIKLWSQDGVPIKTLPLKHQGLVRSVSFSQNNSMLVSASDDGTVKLWQLSNGSLLTDIEAHRQGLWAMGASLSPDGKMIVSVGTDKEVKLWTANGTLLKVLSGHGDAIYGVAFSPDGKTIASASADRTVRIWSTDGPFLKNLQERGSGPNRRIIFSPDGNFLASASWDATSGSWTVKLWHSEGKLLHTLLGHRYDIRCLSFSRDSQLLASASWDGTINLWNTNGELLRTLTEHQRPVESVDFSPDGQTIVSSGHGGIVRLWKIDGTPLGLIPSELDGTTHEETTIFKASFSPDGKILAFAGSDRLIKLWKVDGRKPLRTLAGHSNWVTSLSFSRDGKILVSTGADRTIRFWRIDGELVKTLIGHTDGVNEVCFSPDGRIFVSASSDRTLKLWSKDGTLLKTLIGHKDGVYGASFSPDGQTIASASWDGTIKIWSAETLDFDRLLNRGCSWLQDYLKTNPTVEEDRYLCDSVNISTQ